MTNTRSIIGVFVVGVTLFLGLWLGVNIVTSQNETLTYVGGAACLLVCVTMGRRIWLLVPFLGALNLTLMVPGMPTTLLLGNILFLVFGFLLILMRKLPFRLEFTELEFWLLMVVLLILQAYLRNPVGMNMFGGGSVGGRPYVLFAISLASALLLGSLIIPISEIKWLVRLYVSAGLLNFGLSLGGYIFPNFGTWFGVATVGTEIKAFAESSSDVQVARISFLGETAKNLSLWISMKVSPLKACLSPMWAPLVLITFVFAGLSGFRNEMIAIILTYTVALFYRGGGLSVVFSCLAATGMLVMIALINTIVPLPGNIQRSLSFLPGTWNQQIAEGASDSTEWRVEMWKEALFTDYWIHNKLLGDGLGFTQQELTWMMSMNENALGGAVGSGKLTMQQQHMLITGSYHSGPVSSVRVVGYAGLVIFLIALIRLAVHAHRQIIRCRGTEWYPLALLIGIPKVWSPFFFVFVFGDFAVAILIFCIGTALIRILEKNVPLPAWEKPKRLSHFLLTHRDSMKSISLSH